MPIDTDNNYSPFTALPSQPKARAAATWSEVWGAAFSLENDMVAAYDLMTRPAYPADPNFKIGEALRQRPELLDYKSSFVNVRSQEAMDAAISRIKEEERKKELLSSAGWSGYAAMTAAGMLSPTTALPLIGGARGLKAIAQGMAYGAGGIAAQEAILQGAQETRTAEESLTGIAIGTVLGGILGGAASWARGREWQAMEAGLDNTVDALARPGSEPVFKVTAEKLSPPAPVKAVDQGEVLTSTNLREMLATQHYQDIGSYSMALREKVGVALRDGRKVTIQVDSKPVEIVSVEGNVFRNISGQSWDAEALFFSKNLDQPALTIEGKQVPAPKAPEETLTEIMTDAARGGYTKVELPDGTVKDIPEEILARAEAARVVDGAIPGPDQASGFLPSAAGAQSVRGPSAGGLQGIGGSKVGFGLLNELSPVTRSLAQTVSRHGQWMQAQLSTAGLRLEKNRYGVASAVGGTVENRIRRHYKKLADAFQALDRQYANYVYGANAGPEAARGFRATVKGLFDKNVLSKTEFREEVSRAKRAGDGYKGIPEARAAAVEIDEVLFKPLLKEAQDIGLMDKEIELVGDVEYLNRLFDTGVIERNSPEFIRILSEWYEEQMQADIAKAIKKMQDIAAKEGEMIEDMSLDATTAAELRLRYEGELAELNKSPFVALEDRMKQLAREDQGGLSEFLDGPAPTKLEPFGSNVKEIGESEAYKNFKDRRKYIKRRLKNLNQGRAALEERYDKALNNIERIEELQLNSLSRLNNKFVKFLGQIDRLSPEAFREQLGKLKTDFAKLASVYDRAEDRMVKLVGEPNADNVLLRTAEEQDVRAAKMTDAAERIEEVDIVAESQEGLRDLVTAMYEETMKKTNDLNSRRALRKERLIARAEKLAPENADARVKAIKAKMKDRKLSLLERYRLKGADDIDIETGTADFKTAAREKATEVKDKILGTFNRLPAMEILQGERGPELARVLSIPSERIEEFLHNDVEYLMRSHVRTIAPDIELTRVFGTADAAMDFRQLQADIDEALSRAKTEKERKTIAATGKTLRNDLTAEIGRLRHTWGIPDNPAGMAARMTRVAQNVNTLRFMGKVMLASVGDMARPVMRYGLMNTMRHGLIPLVNNFKTMKISMKEAQLAGSGLDLVLHTRAYALADIMDEFGRTSPTERALEAMTSKIGIVALFDYWNQGAKMFSAAVMNGQTMEALNTVVNGGGKKATAEATEYLASLGINGDLAFRMWDEVVTNGGGGKVNNVWMPQTELWRDRELANAYHAAVAGELDATIVTPGLERPLWMDSKSLSFKLIGQFRSFAFSSTQKTLMAGLQRSDAAFINGILASVPFGALSYYLYAMASGGKQQEEMENADLARWTDEIISRSGVIGILSEVQRLGERIPATQPYANFSGDRVARRGGSGIMSAAFGPSFDLADTAARIATGIDDPTAATLGAGFNLIPYNNVFWLQRAFQQMEETTADALNIPMRRN